MTKGNSRNKQSFQGCPEGMLSFDEFKRVRKAGKENPRAKQKNSSQYSHQNVSRTSLHSKASPYQNRESISDGSTYSKTNVSRMSLESVLSFDDYKKLKRENEQLRAEHAVNIANLGAARAKHPVRPDSVVAKKFTNSTATQVVSNKINAANGNRDSGNRSNKESTRSNIRKSGTFDVDEKQVQAMHERRAKESKQVGAMDAVRNAFDNVDAQKAMGKLLIEQDPSNDENMNTPNIASESIFPDLLGRKSSNPNGSKRNSYDSLQRMKQDAKSSKAAVAKNMGEAATTIATTISHTTQLVAPKIANASKVVAETIVEATKAAKSIDMAMVTAKTPAKSNRTSATVIMPNGRYADYVHDPNYKVELTPPPKTPAQVKTPYGYLTDPSTPHCLRGAMAAGACGLAGNHPEHPEFLPHGMPQVIEFGEGWEEEAGFVSAATIIGKEGVNKKNGRNSAQSTARSTFDTTQLLAECHGRPIDMDATIQASVVSTKEEGPPELESIVDEADEERDPRNHSMWVCGTDEDLEEEDTIMDLGDIIVNVEDEALEKDNEFCAVPPGIEEESSPVSCGTYHIGDLFSFEDGDDALTPEMPVGDNENDAVMVETVASEVEETSVYEDCKESVEKLENPIFENQLDARAENVPFQTPYSVQKGERPLTFTEFRHMNKRVLFDGEGAAKDTESADPQLHFATEEEKSVAMVKSPARVAEENPRYSIDWLLEQDSVHSKKIESGKRQLKGRVILLRIGKKISKAKSKGKNVLRQVFVLPLRGSKNKKPTISNGERPASASHSMPFSPSSVSVASIASSVMSTGSKRIIGAIPVYRNEINTSLGLPYGAINYARSASDSTVDDALPPPPSHVPKPEVKSDNPDEDAVSYIAAAMHQRDADEFDDEEMVVATEEDVASIVATFNAEELDGDENSVILIVTPKHDQEGSYQVIGGFDGKSPVNAKNILDQLDAYGDESAAKSDIKPNNLTGFFTEKNKNEASFSIVEADEGFVLTPVASVNNNVANVFRRSTDSVVAEKLVPNIRRSTGTPIEHPTSNTATLPNLLPRSESDDDEEDETLLYHDGCTLIHHASTFGDATIATTTTAAHPPAQELTPELKQEIKKPTVFETPDQPSFSKQAEKNGSFLFSEGNMGRAGPRIRAQERAALKEGVASSLTMLPAASEAKSMESKDVTAIVSRLSYSSQATDAPPLLSATSQGSNSPMPLIAIKPTVELKKSFDDSVKVEIQKKPVMSSMTEPRQFSFKSTLNKFSPDSADLTHVEGSPLPSEDISAKNNDFSTPLVTNCAQKKTYPATPFPENVATADDVDSPLPSVTQCAVSPADSTTSKSSRKKLSPKQKSIPKSALKTRKGLVKDRISDIQQRLEGSSAVTGINGRLKKNHSYKLKNPRRMTNGESVLAPRKAVLQNPIFSTSTSYRSVPIGIVKSYSRDDGENTQVYVAKADSFESGGITRSFSGAKNDKEKSAAYASKDISANKKSPNNSSSPCSQGGASYVSESTECDPFNTLLGKLSVDDDSSDDSTTGNKVTYSSKGKENKNTNNVDVLPFKSRAFVKPTEINQHDNCIGDASSKQPLSRTPMQARTWRTLAAAAAEKKMSSQVLRHD